MKLERNHLIVGGLAAVGVLWWLRSSASASYAVFDRSAPPGPQPGRALPSTSGLSDKFFRDMHTLAATLQARGSSLSAEDILSVFMSESGVNPASKNAMGFAGLNGMGPRERAATGFSGSIDEYVALSAEDQLPYVQRYIELDIQGMAGGDYRVLSSPAKLYQLNFAPAYIKQSDPNFALYRAPTNEYNANKQLDTAGKGYISIADLDAFLERRLASDPNRWAALRQRLADNAPGVV